MIRAVAVEAGDGREAGLAAAEARGGGRVRRAGRLRPAAVARLDVADHLEASHWTVSEDHFARAKMGMI